VINLRKLAQRLACAALLVSGSLSLHALDMRAVEAELSGPITILLDGGNRQTGTVNFWDGERLRLEVSLGAGSAEMTYPAEEIVDIGFPGTEYLNLLSDYTRDPNRVEESLALFRAFYKQRGAYLQFMNPGELDLFIRYARYALEKDEPLRAVAIIEVLRPYIEDEALLKSLDDSALLAFFLGGLKNEAEAQARKWIEAAGPAHESALGWRILAEIHFEKERYEEALWTALYPVAFANQMPMEHLNECYAFAIAAAKETRQQELSERLTREMAERELAWPDAINILTGFQPPGDLGIESVEPSDAQSEADALGPIQSPSPLDPEASLPTRILQQTTDRSTTPR
jgi:hypothetical protein